MAGVSTSSYAPGDVGTILVVCTGNICRSPYLEALLQRVVDDHWGTGAIRVRSGGTRGLQASAMEPHAHARLVRHGLQAPDFRSRRLEGAHVREADLVLTATRSHRATVVQQEPTALRRAFTVRELGLIATGLSDLDLPSAGAPRAWLQALVRIAAVRRARLAGVPGEDLDILDPYGQQDPAYDRMADQIGDVLPWVGWAVTGGERPSAVPGAGA